ncbi:MAG: helix-turn-helix domain-containing protein [Gaiellales bacterium]
MREIQDAAVDARTPLPVVLRKCMVRAARLGHKPFKEWVDEELNGYPREAKVPAYRRIKRLGMTLKRLRQGKGKKPKMTQAQLAEKAGVHRIYIAQIEAGTKVPSIATLEKVAKVLGVPVGRLLE